MELHANRALGFMEVWLTNDDQKNEALLAWLKSQYPIWNSQKLKPVLYRSGHEDLYENTLALLRYNRRRSAERELEQEKSIQGFSLTM